MSGPRRCAIAPGLLTALCSSSSGRGRARPITPRIRRSPGSALGSPTCTPNDAENGGNKEEKEGIKLMADSINGGAVGEKALYRMAEIEFQGRLDSARAESDRRKADFLKNIRSLHQKKLELAEAESEYKSSR